MRNAPGPRLHLFVCANRREGSSLGPGCAERGDGVYDALKREVAARGAFAQIWITKTHCLGICPKRGATVARYPAAPIGASPIVSDVEVSDVPALLHASAVLSATSPRQPEPGALPSTVDLAAFTRELEALEALQKQKVLDLARRLKPGLTLEDVQNPHDFPELADPDWHYADGVLTGIASVKAALLALEREASERAGDE